MNSLRRVPTAFVVALVLTSTFVGPASAVSDVDDASEPTLHVSVAEDGDAIISLVTVHDLADADEQRAFETLADDDEAQAELRDRFANRVASVADALGEDGASVVSAASVAVRSEGDRGIVVLAVTWADLASVEDGTLTVTEPFASGFESDRRLVVTGPEGSTVVSATPEPTASGDERVSWDAARSLEGFEVAMSLAESDASTSPTATDSIPGFGAAVAAVAAVAVGSVAGRYALSGRAAADR